MQMSDKVLLMSDGKIMAQGTYEELKSQNLLDHII